MKAGSTTEAKHEKICQVCGCTFLSKTTWGKNCSLRCKNKAARNKLDKKICAHCGLEYQPSNIGQKCCSLSCAAAIATPSRIVTCEDCQSEFTYNGRGRCYRCSQCAKIRRNRQLWERSVRLGKIKNPGAGSGGAQLGSANHQWKGGTSRPYVGNYRTTCFRYWKCKCVVCGRTVDVEVHHIDGDGKNNQGSNLVPLCHEHHWNIHHERKLSKEQLIANLEKIWPNCRLKIAEKTGNPSDGQPEVKACDQHKSAATTRS